MSHHTLYDQTSPKALAVANANLLLKIAEESGRGAARAVREARLNIGTERGRDYWACALVAVSAADRASTEALKARRALELLLGGTR